MKQSNPPSTDVDSAGVYFISVEDFEARQPPRKRREAAEGPREEGSSTGPG